MFCPKCGKQLPDGSNFCDACGARVADFVSEASAAPVENTAPETTAAPVENTTPETAAAPVESATPETVAAPVENAAPETAAAPVENAAPETAAAPAENAVPVASAVPGATVTPAVNATAGAGQAAPAPNKKNNTKMGLFIGVGVAAVAVIGILMFAVVKLFSSVGGGDNAYAYISNGKYELLRNLKKGETVEFASSRSDDVYYSMLAFSPDGKYVYYYTKIDDYNMTGSLCRAEFKKLKENSGKNDKYIEIIATNVELGFSFLDDGTVIYKNGNGSLYHYDGKESNQIAKSVNRYYADGSRYVIYTTGNYSDDNAIYGVDLKDVDNKVKLASNYYNLYYLGDIDNIFYTKVDDDYNQSLYVVGFKKDSEKIGDNVNVWSTSDDAVYFSSTKGNYVSLYDYVEDDYRTADEGITEPNTDDYSTPVYNYSMLNSYNDPAAVNELYASCTKPCTFVVDWWYNRSLEWASQNVTDEAIRARYQEFVNKYIGQENEDGYFPVTDAVRSDIIALAQATGEGYDNEWLELCFNRYEAYRTTDWDAYNIAYNVYSEARNRINMRETLMDSENDYPSSTLYAYQDGKLTTIGEDILNYRVYNGVLLYNTTDLVTKKVNIEDIYSTWDVTSLFSIDYDDQNYLVIIGETTAYQLSASAADAFGEANDDGYARLYAFNKSVYMSEDNGALSVASVKNGTVENFTFITDDAEILHVGDSVLYYASNTYTASGEMYGDVYSYSKDKSERLAQDVMLDWLCLYEDDVILAATGYRSNRGYEITMIDAKGNSTYIADNITMFIRADKSTILYISDGDLYYYTKKEKSMIEEDVDYVWSMNQMQETWLGYY